MTDDVREPWLDEAQLADIPAMKEMAAQLLAPVAPGMPDEALEGLARELIAHNGDAGFDPQEAIDRWAGPYIA